jgi:hypothetical protein
MKGKAAKKGEWVQIHMVVLQPQERSDRLPKETSTVPLEMWAKGFLLNGEARLGDSVEIETEIGRRLQGSLSAVNPGYTHSFGAPIPELLQAGRQLRSLLREAE